MRRHVRKALIGGAAALAIAAAVAATYGSSSPTKTEAPKAGGTYRVGWEASFGFTNAFDPTGEYLGDAFGILSDLMVRTLVGYNHVAGGPGNQIVPDLAVALPKPTNGGKTYTFHLKSGIRFGPPVSREITSKDVVYAMQRLANPKDGGQYSFYYTVIKGWDAYAKGKANAISGITTPNATTIVFNLTEPTGDFLYRMGMPATGPIPEEVAKCFEGQPGKYGRDLVSSGPYMFEGADSVDASSCSALKPMSGFDGQTIMTLVRNPDYKASTDSKAAREALPDKFVFSVNTNPDDIANKIEAGDLEDVDSPSLSPKVLRRYVTSSSLKSRLHLNFGDITTYITMNLTQAPFDDIHVRKAMNLILDKDGLRKAWGGSLAGAIANHIVPDTMFNDQIKSFAPYKTPGDHGSVAKAAAEMKQSRYDTNHDGKCDASQCKGILMIADVRSVDTRMVPVIESSAAKIGITFKVRTVNGAYPVIQTPSKNIPISERPRWGKDYGDPLTFFAALFTSGAIIPSGNTNYSLVGITPALAKKIGVKGNLSGIPSIDSQFAACSKLTGQPRLSCWENLDKYLMTKVVPWVPYMWTYQQHILGPNVTKWNFDQFAATTAYAHVAVK